MRTLKCCDEHIDCSLLTTNPDETPLRVVPLKHINMKQLAEYAEGYDTVIGIKPTGWTLGKGQSTSSSASPFASSSSSSSSSSTGQGDTQRMTLSPSHQNGRHAQPRLICYGVPYSEHSSYTELRDCVRVLSPRVIEPTVNAGSAEKQRRMLLAR